MLEIKGYSNSNLSIFKRNNKFLVKKYGKNTERLFNQKAKQKEFLKKIQPNIVLNQIFSSPIIEDGKDFIMEFCDGDSVLDIIEYGKPKDIDIFLEKIETFLLWEFSNSTPQKVNKNIFLDKILKIDTLYRKTEIINFIEDFEIPIGFCHGDLTFSNMIISDKIFLIDFLDSYVESPLQDLAKLLQEVNLFWTIHMSIIPRDKIKLMIGYEYIKKRLETMIEKICSIYKIDTKILTIFYIITLFRIFPYVKEEKIYKILEKELDIIINKL